MGLRNRIILMVAVGLLVATAPLGIMGLAMVQAATDRILQERLVIAEVTAAHLSDRIARGWWQLDQFAARVAPAVAGGDDSSVQATFEDLAPQLSLFSGGAIVVGHGRRYLAGRIALQEVRASDLRSAEAVLRATETGRHQTQTVVSGPGRPALALLATPIPGTDDQTAGVIVGIIDLNQPTLATFIRGLAVGTTGHAAIVAQDGTVLASTETDELFTREEHPDHFAALITDGRSAVGPAADVAGPSHHHLRHVMAFAPLEAVPWGVGIGQSEEETFGPIGRLRSRIVVFETAVLVAAMVLAWWDTTAVIRPLRLLHEATERIAEGDLTQVVEVRRGDEIGTLARSFETMRGRLLRSLEENARLQEQLQSVAIVEERERLAREMHDSVGQVLGYVNTKAQAVRALVKSGRAVEAEAQLTQLEEAAREVYADLREAILSLRTVTGPNRPLLPTLREYVQRFTEQTGVETALVVEERVAGGLAFPTTAEAHLLRIVQEALTNVRKHAAATHATVRIGMQGDFVVVTVEDDGLGIGGRTDGTRGYGLQTMRERAGAIGGTLEVNPGRDKGTVVKVVVPIQEDVGHAPLAG